MENKIYGCVYLITNLINGKRYIGQTTIGIEKRFKAHYSDSKSSRSNKMAITNAIKKHGKENFTIKEIAISYNQEQLNFSEEFYIKSFNTLSPNGYNLKLSSSGRGYYF